MLNTNDLTRMTGDVFADTGGIVIKKLLAHKSYLNWPILKLIEEWTDFYVDNWGSGQLSPFYLNSTITQNSFNTAKKKKSETIKYFKALLEEEEEEEMGYCRILGIKAKLYVGGRNNQILSGSGKYINFHHHFDGGTRLSAAALIRMFFVPLGLINIFGRPVALSSSIAEVSEKFVEANLKEHLKQIALNSTAGLVKSEDQRPETALFNFARRLIEKWENVPPSDIQLYHFTNFSAKPDVDLYRLNHPEFTFYKRMQNYKLQLSWKQFVNSFFRNNEYKNLAFNEEENTFEGLLKKEQKIISENDFSHWYNHIYIKLINSDNILYDMFFWTKKRHGQNFLNTKIATEYAKIILKMENETIKKIEFLADFIVSGDDKTKVKKRVNGLLKAKKQYAFREYILKLAQKNHADNKPNPLITLEEYACYLFPSDSNSSNIRTLLLISIYEKLHQKKIFFTKEETVEQDI